MSQLDESANATIAMRDQILTEYAPTRDFCDPWEDAFPSSAGSPDAIASVVVDMLLNDGGNPAIDLLPHADNVANTYVAASLLEAIAIGPVLYPRSFDAVTNPLHIRFEELCADLSSNDNTLVRALDTSRLRFVSQELASNLTRSFPMIHTDAELSDESMGLLGVVIAMGYVEAVLRREDRFVLGGVLQFGFRHFVELQVQSLKSYQPTAEELRSAQQVLSGTSLLVEVLTADIPLRGDDLAVLEERTRTVREFGGDYGMAKLSLTGRRDLVRRAIKEGAVPLY